MAFAFEYRVVPFAASTKAGAAHANVAAEQFQALLGMHAIDGFEYFRMDHYSLYEAPGCIPALFGAKSTQHTCDVAVFRRAR